MTADFIFKALMESFVKTPSLYGFEDCDITLIEKIGALPILRFENPNDGDPLTTVRLMKPDGSIVSAKGEHPWNGVIEVSAVTLRTDRELTLTVAASRYPELSALLPKKDENCVICRYCEGLGVIDIEKNKNYGKSTPPFESVVGIGNICHLCEGRGWRYDPRRDHQNLLQRFFENYWRCWDFDDDIITNPNETLKIHNLDIGSTLVEIRINNLQPKNDCWECQLTEPLFELALGACTCDTVRTEDNPLLSIIRFAQTDDYFREMLLEDTRNAFRTKGLSTTDNIVLSAKKIGSFYGQEECPECHKPRCAIRIVTGYEGNVCCCKDPVLADILYEEANPS